MLSFVDDDKIVECDGMLTLTFVCLMRDENMFNAVWVRYKCVVLLDVCCCIRYKNYCGVTRERRKQTVIRRKQERQRSNVALSTWLNQKSKRSIAK